MLIRNPYDAILSNYNRMMGNVHAGGTKSHVGKATMDDFMGGWSNRETGFRFQGKIRRWLRLYNDNILDENRDTLPIFYEDLKARIEICFNLLTYCFGLVFKRFL